MSERTLLVGYDLGDTKTQIAVYNKEMMEPVLIEQTDENPDGFLETAIDLDGDDKLTGFVEKIRQGEEILVQGKKSQPVNVLAHYFSKTLSLTRKQYPGELIRQLVVTAVDATQEFVEIVYEALEKIGIERDRALVIGHKQSFLYYVLYQKKELWVNDVGLFDCHGTALEYCQMRVDRRKSPILVGTIEKEYKEALRDDGMDRGRRAAIFENIVYGAIHKQLLSTLYMTGDGFEGDWADEVFQKLCIGRRLFKGQNLYVSGACYAAREVAGPARLEDYLLLDKQMITNHVFMKAYADADVQTVTLAKAGTPWYLVDEEVDIIPDGDNEICLTAENIFDHSEKQFFLDFEPVRTRLDRHCRIGIRVRFASPKKCIVTMCDRGFGELFPSSHRVWEKTIELA